MDKVEICTTVLQNLENGHTKVVYNPEFNGNYYVCVLDTIYLGKIRENKENEYIMICHECIHSLQSRWLHLFNFILSNLELLMFIMFLIFQIMNLNCIYLFCMYATVCSLSIIVRGILEVGAINGSLSLARKLFAANMNLLKIDKLLKYKHVLIIFGMSYMVVWKILRLIFCIVLKVI